MEYLDRIKLKKECLDYITSKCNAENININELLLDVVYNCYIDGKNLSYRKITFAHLPNIVFNLYAREFEIIEDKIPTDNNITIERIEQILNDNFDSDDIQDIIKCLKDNLFKEIVKDQSWMENQLNEQKQLYTNYMLYHNKAYTITGNIADTHIINPHDF